LTFQATTPVHRRNDILIPACTVLSDIIAIEAAFLVSYYLRFQTSFLRFLPLTEAVPPLQAYVVGSLVVIPVWVLLFNSRKMYGARRNVAPVDDLLAIFRTVTLGMMIILTAAFFERSFSYSRVVFVLLWATAILILFGGRMVIGVLERWLYRRGRELRNAVIVGSAEIANQVFTALGVHPLLGYRIVGYLSVEPCAEGSPLAAAAYLGRLEEIAGIVQRERIELVLVALGSGQQQHLPMVVQECEGINIEFMLVPDFIHTMSSPMRVTEIGGIPFVRLKGVPMTSWGRLIKRSFDVIVSLLLLLILSPFLLCIASLIRLGSRGPIFYTQTRIGIDGRKFEMIKFRSMVQDAEKASGPVWAGGDDPRQTAVGRFLRRTSLDELPQLFNVLRGDMSLVGPRPERPYFVEKFSQENAGESIRVPKYLDRHRLRTGMTGWAQVNGLRGKTSIEERIKYDLYYIENWSFGFDLKILLRTVGVFFHGSGQN
jgi:exopolysaccharide biosynthesis polyprenyl glycosylphosphotransferase